MLYVFWLAVLGDGLSETGTAASALVLRMITVQVVSVIIWVYTQYFHTLLNLLLLVCVCVCVHTLACTEALWLSL